MVYDVFSINCLHYAPMQTTSPGTKPEHVIHSVGMVDQPCLCSEDGERDFSECLEHSKEALLVGLIGTKLINYDGPQVEIAGVRVDAVDCHCLQEVGRMGRELGREAEKGKEGGRGGEERGGGEGRRERRGGRGVKSIVRTLPASEWTGIPSKFSANYEKSLITM